MYCYTDFGCPEGQKCVEAPKPPFGVWADICGCATDGDADALSLDCGPTVTSGNAIVINFSTSASVTTTATVTLEDSLSNSATVQISIVAGRAQPCSFALPTSWQGILRARCLGGATCASIF